jgi:hypothetical protein
MQSARSLRTRQTSSSNSRVDRVSAAWLMTGRWSRYSGTVRTTEPMPEYRDPAQQSAGLPNPFFRWVLVVATPFDYASRDLAVSWENNGPQSTRKEGNKRPRFGHEHNLNDERSSKAASCKTANLGRKALAYPKAVLGPALPKGSVGPGCFGCPLAGAARAASVSTLLFRWDAHGNAGMGEAEGVGEDGRTGRVLPGYPQPGRSSTYSRDVRLAGPRVIKLVA